MITSSREADKYAKSDNDNSYHNQIKHGIPPTCISWVQHWPELFISDDVITTMFSRTTEEVAWISERTESARRQSRCLFVVMLQLFTQRKTPGLLRSQFLRASHVSER
jgi:hypothetical protein